MNFSRFMIACALHGGDEDDGEEGPRLVLSEDEQRSLYGRVALLFLLFQLPLFLPPLTAIDLGLVSFEVGLDLRRQAFHLVHRAGTAVEMPPEGRGVVEDFATIGERPPGALAPLGIAVRQDDVGAMRVGFASALVPLPERGLGR